MNMKTSKILTFAILLLIFYNNYLYSLENDSLLDFNYKIIQESNKWYNDKFHNELLTIFKQEYQREIEKWKYFDLEAYNEVELNYDKIKFESIPYYKIKKIMNNRRTFVLDSYNLPPKVFVYYDSNCIGHIYKVNLKFDGYSLQYFKKYDKDYVNDFIELSKEKEKIYLCGYNNYLTITENNFFITSNRSRRENLNPKTLEELYNKNLIIKKIMDIKINDFDKCFPRKNDFIDNILIN